MVTINNDVDQDIINQNPTPHEIKERLATLSLNGKTQRKPKEHGTQATDNSDQENQKPQNTHNSSEKGRKKSKKQRISLTPSFFGGRKSESNEEHTDKIHSILGVKDYSSNRTSAANSRRSTHHRDNGVEIEIEPTEKLFIGKLPLTLTEEELFAHFSQFGQIIEAIIKEQRGFGFVTFSSIDEANRALDASHCLHGTEIEVKRAMPNRFSQMKSSLSTDHHHLHGGGETDGASTQATAQWGEYHPMYQAQPYAYAAPPMFIPTAYPPPLIANVTPIEPVSPPHHHQHHHHHDNDNNTTTSPHETTSSDSKSIDYHHHQHHADNNVQQQQQQQHHMDGDFKQQCKLFIGGLHWKTQDSDLKDYFAKMGTVTDAMVILEPNSQRSRGFGFVVFSNAEEAQNVFADKEHEINGKTVEVKRAISKDDDADSDKLAHVPVDKIFVGGIRKDTTKDFLIQYFQNTFDGNVTRVDMKTDGDGANRGFAFITFDTTDVVDRICASKFHRIGSHFCEVKKAHPKNADLDNNNARRTEKLDYAYRGVNGSNGGSYDSYAYSAFSPAQSAAAMPHVWYHPGYAHAGVAVPPPPHAAATYHHGEMGEYIGGTWYPKQQNGSDSGLPDAETASNLAPTYGIPTLVYPASYSYYPAYASPSAAYFPQQQQQQQQLPQKDI